ncbi:MAG: hypothetical protein COZ69_13490 [Deltaproteobacteria bacterium CG_4_8_14_3_um_filter_45_9]|nr:MAG: hypothetical protein COS40_00990 [Deltaproteobacteria bacterium CG03_land_8_20_14_0_80_45_14]PIX21671.1 MAG: hypothetical protein COZ69_13490 [Deltaproteobacteria bacterium CG_4_8_14_3_um_filter_45_9]
MKTICLIFGIIVFLWVPGAEAKDFRFPEIKGWKQSGEIQTFIPKTLFEYINGAADFYLVYDFQELKVAEYLNEKKASVTVEIYRHKTPTYAFGIYSQERNPKANFINVGAQGYVEEEILNFIAGPYYVKITGYKIESGAQEVLISFAKEVLENLGEKGILPARLNSFPREGKVKNSEKFIAKNFLGYAFLHSAFTADYELSGTKFKLFVIDIDRKECKDMIQKYLQQTKSPEKNIAEGIYTISDPYHGEIGFHWKGKFIWGIFNFNDYSLRSKYLKLFEEMLSRE